MSQKFWDSFVGKYEIDECPERSFSFFVDIKFQLMSHYTTIKVWQLLN
jgi:hypothetical protein